MTGAEQGRIPGRVLLFYALPAFVVALPTIPVYIHLPSLYGVQLGLGLAATGAVLLLARLFDTVTDPLVGLLCDRFALRGLYRKPWIAAGAVVAGLGLFRILNPPADVDAAYLLTWSLVLYAGWTMVAVPYTAWGAELSPDYDERTRITAWREGAGLLGVVGAGGIVSLTAGAGWDERASTGAIAWVAIALGAVFVPLLLILVREGQAGGIAQAPAGRRSLRKGVRSLIANRPFLRLLTAWFVNGLANGIPAALFFIYLEFGLGAGASERPLFVLAYFAAAILSIPLWQACSRRIGKHRTWCVAMLLTCAAFVTVPVIPDGAFAAFAAVCVITGMGLGADLVLPPAIQADVLDYQRYRFGRARAGIQFALWGMSTKLALAVAVGLALPGLEIAGFDPAAPTAAGRHALTVIYALLPVVIKIAAIAIVWRFPLTARRQTAIRHRLERRDLGSLKREEAT